MSTDVITEATETTDPAVAAAALTDAAAPAEDVLVEDELLVEEVSIDGMCGVY